MLETQKKQPNKSPEITFDLGEEEIKVKSDEASVVVKRSDVNKYPDTNNLAKPNQGIQLMDVIDKAMNNENFNVQILNDLLSFQERIEAKDAVKSFNLAMAKAMGEIPSFEKDKSGHNYKYATFQSMNKVIKPILAKYGLFLTFEPNYEENYATVTCEIIHVDGHSKKNIVRLPYDTTGSKNGVQSVGSTNSYGMRYAMIALLNLTTHDEDDDGFLNTKKISKAELARLNDGIVKAGIDKEKLLNVMKVDQLSDILAVDFADASGFLMQIINGKASNDNK